MSEAVALVVPPGAGQTVEGPAGGPLTFKARAEQTDGALTALESVIAPGDGPPLHTHGSEEEALYVLEGELRVRLGDELSAAPAGTFVFVPRGVPHNFQNVGDEPARILVLFAPAGMERFFDGFAAMAGTSAPEAFRTAAAPAGMEVVGPPLGRDTASH
jgi:quercetin dioxygenase-like cupin family protein